MAVQTLADVLDSLTVEGQLYEVVDAAEKKIRCYACAHRCLIKDGRRGICQVRYNEEGVLRVPHGYVSSLQVDPVEKKPFFHVMPGAPVLTFGMLGCNFHCPFCQNWISSQALRDGAAGASPEPIDTKTMVEMGARRGAKLVARDCAVRDTFTECSTRTRRR